MILAVNASKIRMQTNKKDAMTDLAQNLPAMAQRPANRAEGTVVAADGTIVTLGEKPANSASVSIPQGGTNQGVETK